MADASRALDLPHISDDVAALSVPGFDAWLAGETEGAYRASTPEERLDLLELDAFRDLQKMKRELRREEAVSTASGSPKSVARLDFLRSQTAELQKYLTTAGWILDE